MNSIRRLAPDDWELLREARLTALAEAPYAFGSTFAEEERLTEHDWRTRCDSWAWFVAVEGTDIAGLVGGAWFNDVAPELVSMWVAPAYRGSGTASALVRSVADWARSEHASELRMCVAEGNARAERFYGKLGLRPTGLVKPLRSQPGAVAHELSMPLSDDASDEPSR